jgi:3'-phosphoadenosine 5'-phosphosulfate (PAPS) 3'-phosphatase
MMLSQTQLLELQPIAAQAATEAGQYIQSCFDQHYTTKSKIGGDTLASQVVTEVDLKAQAIILSRLEPSIAQHDFGLLTEEAVDDQSRNTKDYFWCVDPLDGTLPFTEHRPGYAVSIALVSKMGDPVIGVVYLPNEQACYSAIKSGGVYRNEALFNRDLIAADGQLHWYMDRSFQSASHYEGVRKEMESYTEKQGLQLTSHASYGAVANAMGVLTSCAGCYFKYPKKSNGGGSIWDYAATRLLFEEVGMPVSNASGEKLHLNEPETTFMNRQGVVYVSDEALKRYILKGMR